MNSPVIVDLPIQTSSLSHQRYLPHIEAVTAESLGFPSTSQNVHFSMENSTMVNTQPTYLLANYRTLADTIGLDRPLSNLIQFGRLELSSVPNFVPHSVASPNIPTPLTLLRMANLTQHGTN